MEPRTPLYPLLLHQNLFELVWGGHALRPLKGMEPDGRPIGESWEVSAIAGRESVVTNGPLAGQTLTQLITAYGDLLLGRSVMQAYGGQFPLLVKLIDAERDLSIQVHPNDALAQERHGCMGKSEMWLVLDAQPGAFLYSGFSQPVSKREYQQRVADGTICQVLQRHEVHPGDVFYIPAGRVHAIGAGILLAEVQQSSDVTYRIFDYNRPGLDGRPRQLHTALAADAIDYRVEADYQTHYRLRRNRPSHAITCPYFQVNLLYALKPVTRHLRKCDTFVAVTCLTGEAEIRIETEPEERGIVVLTRARSCLIPASLADYVVTPLGGQQVCLLEAFIDNYRPWHKHAMNRLLSILE